MNDVIINNIIKNQDKYNEKGIVFIISSNVIKNYNSQYNCFLLK